MEDGFKFLGYHFDATGMGPAVKAVAALEFRLAELAGDAVLDPEEVDALFRGWTAYYGQMIDPWLSAPVGILALLRARDSLSWDDATASRILEARWRLPDPPLPRLPMLLAEAWMGTGLAHHAWVELMRSTKMSLDANSRARWAELLAIPREAVDRVLALRGPDVGRQLHSLAEVATECGAYEVARRIAASGAFITPVAAPSAQDDGEAAADIPLLQEWFQGRDGVHGVEQVDHGGHRRFLPHDRPILADDWIEHLAGRRTLALPLVRTDGTVLIGVFDLDVARRELDARLGDPQDLIGRALGAALRIQSRLEAEGAASVVEFSGHKGYHVWLRFAAPVPSAEARAFLLRIAASAAPLPEAIVVEVFPNIDRLRSRTVGRTFDKASFGGSHPDGRTMPSG